MYAERAKPDAIMSKLGQFRRQYDQGSISFERFREILRQFRFKDDYGRLWMPGVNSNNWYMWENERWVVYAPPETLILPTYEERVEAFKARPTIVAADARFCMTCGERARVGAKFCQRCGQPVQP